MGKNITNEQLDMRLDSIDKKLTLIIDNLSPHVVVQASSASRINQKEILTFYEAVEFLGVSKSLLYKMTAKMLLPHYKPRGKMVYFDKKELEDWIREGRIDSIIDTLNMNRHEEKG